ncbi:transcriptional repressor LexA [soil metagenome]
MRTALTDTERDVLDYLIDYLRENTYQPSIREIGKRFSIKSTKTVSELLQSIADKGFIERDSSRSRGVHIPGLDLKESSVMVPLYGKIAAGEPMLLKEHIEGRFAVDPELTPSPASFFLRVVGESMENVGICDGDMVLVEPIGEGELRNGEIVAARIDGGATVKRYFQHGEEVVLEPANTDFAPLLVRDYEDFAILGRVGGLFRRFERAELTDTDGR